MKALRVIAGFVLVTALLITGVLPALAVEASEDIGLKSAQLYPIMTTSEWEDMSRTDRVAACQISEQELTEMSTEDLLQYVLNYPFMIDMYAFSTYEMGFEHVCSEFEALPILVGREDYGQVLIDTYSSVPVETSLLDRSADCYQNIWDLGILEILIAQPEMTDSLSATEISDLATIAEQKYVAKSNALEIYSGSCASFAQALAENPDSAIATAASSPVKTPAGSNVAVIDTSRVVDWTSTEKATLDAQALASYPTTTLLRSASKKYNCHSYAW